MESQKKRIPIARDIFHEPSDASDKPYLIGVKCRRCGNTFFPKRPVCPICLRDDSMEQVALSGKGKIQTFSVVGQAPPGFVAPYIQAWVDLAEGPRIFSLITGIEPSDEALQIGMDVEFVIDKLSDDEDGNEVIGYKFRPVKK